MNRRTKDSPPAALWASFAAGLAPLAAACALLCMTAALACADPRTLVSEARELLLQPLGRGQAEADLKQAISAWEKQGAKSGDYAEALVLLGIALNPSLAKDKEALEAQVEPLARKALAIRQGSPDTKAADLALALEFDALVLEELGRIDDSRDPKAKARAIRDEIIAAMLPFGDDPAANPMHIGGSVRPPLLLARTDPHLTFAARVLMLQPEIVAEVVIAADGLMRQIEIYKPAGFGLDENAVRALMQWRFKPAEKNGVPVAVEGNIRLRFLP